MLSFYVLISGAVNDTAANGDQPAWRYQDLAWCLFFHRSLDATGHSQAD